MTCEPVPQSARTPGIWNPLPYFDTVQARTGSSATSSRCTNFYEPRATGTLPAVSWVDPNGIGQRAPARAASAAARTTSPGSSTPSCAAPTGSRRRSSSPGTTGAASTTTSSPPTVDENGYGLRVPGLVISPYARQGYIDHQTLSFDAYVKFIEDDFLGGSALDPPDRRPARPAARRARERCRSSATSRADFDFTQKPRPAADPPTARGAGHTGAWLRRAGAGFSRDNAGVPASSTASPGTTRVGWIGTGVMGLDVRSPARGGYPSPSHTYA